MDEKKRVSKKQQACVTRYVAAHYDRLSITVPQGMKGTISAAAKSLYGEAGSVNGFVNAAIIEKLENPNNGADGEARHCNISPAVPDGLVSAETLKTIQAHIAEVGASETPEVFIARAVNDTIARDRQLKRLGRDKQGKSMWQMPEVKAE